MSKNSKQLIVKSWQELTPEEQRLVSLLYCEIWKEPPWHEHFWEPGKVLSTMKQDMTRQNAYFLVCFVNNRIVAFCNGYSVTMDELSKIANKQIPHGLFRAKNPFYIDSLACHSNFRRRGISSILTKKLIEAISCPQACEFTLRTDIGSMAMPLYLKLGFNELNFFDGVYEDRRYLIYRTK